MERIAWTCPDCDTHYQAVGATEAIALRAFIAWPGCELCREES